MTYDGNPHTATGTATGAGGVNLDSDLNLSGTTHTAAGTYASDGWTFTNPNYKDASGTVSDVINQAQATATLSFDASSLTQTYDGTARVVTVTTNPAALSGVSITYGGSATAPTDAGSYALSATLTNANYQADPIAGTLTVAQATATLSFDTSSLTQTYDGTARVVTVTTNPAALSGVAITYDGSTTAPTGVGALQPVGDLDQRQLPGRPDHRDADGPGRGDPRQHRLLAGSVVLGQEVTLTATFYSTPAGSAPMTGTVAFYDGNTYLGTEPLIATVAAARPAATPARGGRSTNREPADRHGRGRTSRGNRVHGRCVPDGFRARSSLDVVPVRGASTSSRPSTRATPGTPPPPSRLRSRSRWSRP